MEKDEQQILPAEGTTAVIKGDLTNWALIATKSGFLHEVENIFRTDLGNSQLP